MTAEAIDQAAALRLQLAAIGGGEPASSYIEVRPLRPDGRPASESREFVPIAESPRRVPEIVAELAGTMNLFVGVCPRVRAEGTAAAVERCWTLWCDLDNPDALARLRDFPPLPSIVIRTGSGGGHAYWALRRSIPREWAQRANRRIALALGGDMAATDPARILRPVSSLNHKTTPARPVVCTWLQPNVFTIDQVVGSLPDTDHYRPRQTAVYPVASDPSRVLAGLARVVREAPVGTRNERLNWASYRAGEHGLDTGEVERELLAAALDAGLTEAEARRTIGSGLRAHEVRAA